MGFFGIIKKKTEKRTYDPAAQQPMIKVSICNGEQVAGFKDIHTGQFEEVMYLKDEDDLARFREMYGIRGEIQKVY